MSYAVEFRSMQSTYTNSERICTSCFQYLGITSATFSAPFFSKGRNFLSIGAKKASPRETFVPRISSSGTKSLNTKGSKIFLKKVASVGNVFAFPLKKRLHVFYFLLLFKRETWHMHSSLSLSCLSESDLCFTSADAPRMSRLILLFAGCTCHKAHYIIACLKYKRVSQYKIRN